MDQQLVYQQENALA
jgi:hypothetical protein